MRWYKKAQNIYNDDPEWMEEVRPLLDAGKVDHSEDFEDGKFRVLGIPEEFGRWYIWHEEDSDPSRGVDYWSILHESDDDPGGIEEEMSTAPAAYEWVMNNYPKGGNKAIAKPDAVQAPPSPSDAANRIYDLSRRARTPDEERELGELIRTHGRPKFMASRRR